MVFKEITQLELDHSMKNEPSCNFNIHGVLKNAMHFLKRKSALNYKHQNCLTRGKVLCVVF